jgi:hypothetical protein
MFYVLSSVTLEAAKVLLGLGKDLLWKTNGTVAHPYIHILYCVKVGLVYFSVHANKHLLMCNIPVASEF